MDIQKKRADMKRSCSDYFLRGHQWILLFARTMLYTHDYTLQGYYLTNPQQLGPIYFKTPNKCGIFGICCESIPWQIKYFIDESVATGKGANSTISYVHDLLEKHGARKTNVHIHADNCGSQNKNNCHWYWCWHVLPSGLDEEQRGYLQQENMRVLST
ncbi:unnamed protein product, partial [Porites lobata]